MFQWLCQPGSYWDPKPFWWLRNSWVATVSYRILYALRIVAWIAWTAVSFAGTLVSDVIFPFVQWLWTLIVGFFSFYLGLLLGQISFDIILFAPFLFLGLAWLWWAFWPDIGCWLDLAWPVFRLLLDLLVAVAGMWFQVFNVLVRIWNSFVPVLGFVVYFSVDILVSFYRGIASLIGEANVEIMFDGITEISLFLSQIIVNVTIAFINITPTLLDTFSIVVGACLNTILEISPVLLQINFVVFRILPFKIGPIADLVVKVVSFVKKTFFLRNLLEFVAAASSIAGTGGLAATAAEPRNADHSDQQLLLWRTFGDSASRYWTPDSARQSSEHLSRINAWLLKNPPGSFSDYHVLEGGDLIHSTRGYYSGSAPLRAKRSDDDSEHDRPTRMSTDTLPEAWQNHTDGNHNKRVLFYPHEHPLDADQLHYLSAEERHAMETHHERLSDQPLSDSLHKRLPCHSRFCGGEGQTVEHPMRTIAKTHVRDRTLLSSLIPKDIRAHRKRAAHLTTLLHSAQHTTHRSFSLWRANKADIYANIGSAWKRWTGHSTFGAAAERVLSVHADPMDSVLAWTPVLSEVWPFRAILDLHPPEEQARYYGRYVTKRQFFVAEVVDEHTGERRKLLHITLNERNDTMQSTLNEDEQPQQHRTKRQQGLGAGGTSFKSGQGNEDMQQVSSDRDFTGGLLLYGLINVAAPVGVFTGPVAIGVGYFAVGRTLEPALPILRILYKHNCFDDPKHPFCLPELPTQLMCLFQYFMRQIPRNLPVKLCGFEEECSDIGFCIHKRPTVQPVVSITKSRAFFISLCWIQNIFVWFGIASGAIFPVLRFSFFIAETAVPFFGPLIFGNIRRLIPEPVSQQDSVCLVIYVYAPMLAFFLLWLFRFAWALVLWGFGALQRLLDLLTAIRAMELARLDSLRQEPWVDEMNLKMDKNARHSLYHDAVFKPLYPVHPADSQRFYNPYEAGEYHRLMANRPPGSGFPQLSYTDYDTTGLPRDQALEATVRSNMYSQVPLPVPVERRIGADIEQQRSNAEEDLLRGRAPITERGRMALHLFIQSLERGAKLFGAPSRTPTTVHHVFAHEARWHPIIHSAHCSATWLSAYLAEMAHQRAQYARRRPPLMSYVRGLFRWK